MIEELKELTGLAVINGPFFFTLFFGLVFIKMSHTYVKNLMARKTPIPQTYEKVMYGMFFVFSIIATFGFGYESVAWWKQNQTQSYKILIRGVQIDKNIIAHGDDIYKKTSFRREDDIGEIKDYTFVILHDGPFEKDHEFIFDFYPETGSLEKIEPYTLTVFYLGKAVVEYTLIYDGNKTKLREQG